TRPDVSNNAGLKVDSLIRSGRGRGRGDLTGRTNEPDYEVREPTQKESSREATDHCTPQGDFKTGRHPAPSRLKTVRYRSFSRVIQAAGEQEHERNESENSCLAQRLDDCVVNHERALRLELGGCIKRKGNERAINA